MTGVQTCALPIYKLLEYQKFKAAAGYLKEKEHQRLKYISRPVAEYEDSGEAYFEASIFDLISAFKVALKDVPRDVFFEVVKEEFTVEEKTHYILHKMLLQERISLEELFGSARSKLEIVVIFLAILELIKLREIVAIQKELFSSIVIARRDCLARVI